MFIQQKVDNKKRTFIGAVLVMIVSMASPALAVSVSARAIIGLDFPAAVAGPNAITFARVCTRPKTPFLTNEDPVGACTGGVTRVITPATPADATSLGASASATIAVAGAIKTLQVSAGALPPAFFAGADIFDPITFDAVSMDYMIGVPITIEMLGLESEIKESGSFHMDFHSNLTSEVPLFALDVVVKEGGDPIVTFLVSDFLTDQSSLWDKDSLESALTQALLSGSINPGKFETNDFELPIINLDVPTNTVAEIFFNTRSDATVVPEPSTLFLFGIGILGLLGYGWRRHQKPGSESHNRAPSPHAVGTWGGQTGICSKPRA